MARIIFADNTGRYDGRSLETSPLGGTEASVVRCARELVLRGHEVTVHSNCDAEIMDHGVRWRPLSERPDEACDAFVVVQHPQLFEMAPRNGKRVLWALWGANQLRHYKKVWRMWRHRPTPILMSQYQVSDYWPVLPGKRPLTVIHLPLPPDAHSSTPLPDPPPPHAIFASNPQRNLNALVRIWAERIWPQVPGAVLDVYGVHQLKAGQDPWREWAGTLLPEGLSDASKASVRVWPTAPRAELLAAIRAARVMLYLGHKCEAFCLSLAEAQALGTPAVIAPVASLPERVVDGVTGFHEADPAAFAEKAIQLLTDDDLWRRQHEAAIRLQQGITCAEYARRFEAAIFGETARADAAA